METLLYFCQLALQTESPLTQSINVQSIDWEDLLRLAARHRVRPLLYKGLMKWEHKATIPVTTITELKKWSFYFATKNLHNSKGLTQLIRTLREQEIEAIPLKGVILSNLAYQDLGVRESSDIDLLIRLEDYTKVKEILHTQGYQSTEMPTQIEEIYLQYNCEQKFELFFEEKQIYNLDIHWLIGNKMQQLDKNYTDIIKLTTPANLFGIQTNLLTPEGLLLTTCLHHGGKERWRFLKNNCDLFAILKRYEQEIDWEKLLQQSHKLKVNNLLLLGLGITSHLFNIKLPSIVTKAIQRANLSTNIQQSLLALDQNINTKISAQTFLESMQYHLNLRASWVTKIKIFYYHIVQFIVPNTNDLNTQNLSTLNYWGLYLKKPFRLWEKYIKQSRSS